MIDLCKLIWCAFARLFRSRAELEAEILVLRHQLNVLRRKSPGRLAFSSIDRVVFAGMYALAPNILDALKIVKPETVLRWHRGGFRRILIWKRILFSAVGVLLVVWWPVANRIKAGAGIQEVESVIFGTGILFLVVGVGSCALAASMHEDHETKYFFSGAGSPALLIGLVYLPQVLG